MSVTETTEIEKITRDFLLLQKGEASDIWYNESFLLKHFLEQRNGIFKRPDSGRRVKVFLNYDGQNAEFYGKGATLDSTDKESLTYASYTLSHAYGNSTVTRLDMLENDGPLGEISLINNRLEGGQKALRKLIADSIYDDVGADPNRIVGLRAMCNETSATAYGGLSEDTQSLWEGKTTSTDEAIGLSVIQALATKAKVNSGPNGKPTLGVTGEELWNVVSNRLAHQQRFTEKKSDPGSVKAGFTGIWYQNIDLFVDDFCPGTTDAYWMFLINPKHFGFAVHKDGLFKRTPWAFIPDSPQDRTLKWFADLQIVTDHRAANAAHSTLSET